MGVWDLMRLHQAIKKWEKLAEAEGLSDSDRNFYLQRVEEAKSIYEHERNNWEIRAKRYGEDNNGQSSEQTVSDVPKHRYATKLD